MRDADALCRLSSTAHPRRALVLVPELVPSMAHPRALVLVPELVPSMAHPRARRAMAAVGISPWRRRKRARVAAKSETVVTSDGTQPTNSRK